MGSIPALVGRLWNTWDARLLVLLSLFLQILLNILGSRRKYITGKIIRIILWSAYLVADKVAIVALAKLSEISDDEAKEDTMFPNNNELRALWAPILLLHMGGPDTISAYSLEDNHLWQRYLVGLAVQAGVAIYVIYSCWTTHALPFMLTFPMFLAGIIKYGEKTWALKYVAVPSDGFFSSSKTFEELKNDPIKLDEKTVEDLKLLGKAYLLFDDLRKQIVNLIYKRWTRWRYSYSIISPAYLTLEDLFKIKEIELGFIYDTLYTKATIIHTLRGSIFRFISCLCIVFTLCGFSLASKSAYANIDIVITYVLLTGAVALEMHAIFFVIYSDWGILWMVKNHKKWVVGKLLKFVAPRSLPGRKMWSDCMGQFNLLSFCLDDKPSMFSKILNSIGVRVEKHLEMFARILKFLDIDSEFMMKHGRVKVTEDLKKLILQIITEGQRGHREYEGADEMLYGNVEGGQREYEGADEMLYGNIEGERKYHKFPKGGKWTIQKYKLDEALGIVDPNNTEFRKSIVLWHIATDICYYSDDRKNSIEYSQNTDTINVSKLVSDYMMYLLVMSPSKFSFTTSLPDAETINYWEIARDEVREKLKGRAGLSEEELCRILREEEPSSTNLGSFDEMLEGRMLVDANVLVECLMEMENRWKVISSMWVELLCHTASQCQVNYHAQQLCEGGELITFVWLLLPPFENYESQPGFFMV